MASRFPSFSINTGLLSNQPMTPEEEAEWLAEQERLYGTLLEPDPDELLLEEEEEEEPEPPLPEDELDEELDEYDEYEEPVPDGMPLVLDVATEPLAPLPGETAGQAVSAKPSKREEAKREQPPEGKPLVVEVDEKPEQPLVLDVGETVDTSSNWVARHRAEAIALREAAEKATKNFEVSPEKAAYAEHFERIVNEMLAEGANAEEIIAAGNRLAIDVYENERLADWEPSSVSAVVRDYDNRVERGGHIPYYRVSPGGKLTDKPLQDQPTWKQSLAKGGALTWSLLGAAQEAVGEVTGVDALTDKGRQTRQYFSGIASVLPEGTKFEDIKSISDALQWAHQTSLEQGVLMALPVQGAVVGRAVGGSLGAKLGAFGPSWALGTGEIQSGNKQVSEEQKAGLATLVGGSAIAALDGILPERIGSALVRSFGRDRAEQMAQRMLLMPADDTLVQRLRSVGREGLRGSRTEALTEGTQTLIGELATMVETGQPIEPGIFGRIIESSITGGLIGGSVSTTVSAAEQVLTPRTQAPEARPLVIPAEERGATVEVRPTQKPVNSEGNEEQFQIPSGRVTSRFGPRQTFQTENGQMASSNHAGIDIALPSGAPAPAGASGVVVFAGRRGGYGNQVVIQHSDGTTSSYSHLSKINAEVGDQVAQGQVIGRVGKTGNATGPHLHLERRDRQGRAVNPLTGGRVVTLRDEASGEWTDNTEWAAVQKEIDNFWDDAFSREEAENAYEDATGQRFQQERAREEEAAEAEAITLAQGEAVVVPEPEPTPPARGGAAVEAAVRSVVGGPGAREIAAAATADLEAAKSRNPARAKLASIQVEERDWSLAQPGEQPVFAEATEESEVVGFISPDTGAFRAIGEPATIDTAQPEPSAPSPPTEPTQTAIEEPLVEEEIPLAEPEPLPEPVQEQAPLAATTEELELERRQRLLDALPVPPSNQSAAVREARVAGQAVGLELQAAPPLSDLSRAERTAFNVGLQEGRNALATEGSQNFVAENPVDFRATTPVATESSVSASVPSQVSRVPALRGRPTNATKAAAAIDQRVEKIEEKLFDLEVEGTKAQVRIFMQRLIREGVLPENAVDSLKYMFSDRDMSVDDITSEIRTDIAIWAEQQKAAKEPAGKQAEPKKAKKPAPKKIKKQLAAKEETSEQNERAKRAEQGRPEADDRGSPEIDEATGERVRPHRNEDGTYSIQHFGPEGLTETDPAKWGLSKSLSPEERAYMEKAPPRTYFGMHTDEPGGYRREFADSVPRYEARVPADKLYDVIADPDGLWVRGRPERGEQNIKDAGYSGYWYKNNELGLVAVVFEKVAVQAVAKSAPKTAPKPVKKSIEAKVQVKTSEAGAWLTESVFKQVIEVLRQMQLDGHPDLTVEIVDSLGKGVQGQFDPEKMLITIAAMAGGHKGQTTKHEIIHWARENKILDRAEWKILKDWVVNHAGLMNWAKATYANEGLTEDEIIEEAIAEGFARWQGGHLMDITTSDDPVVKVFEKFLRVLRAIRNALFNSGISRGQINAAAQLFEALRTGEQFKKAAARGKKVPTVTFGKRRTPWMEGLSREMLSGNISVEQREFLARNPGQVKFQSAWHGSPKEDIEQFKLDFIGSGEGAQAFGWGLYFAERQGVAEWYRKKLVLGGQRDPVDVAIEVDGTSLRDHFAGHNMGAVYEVADRIMNFMAGHKPYNGWLDALHAEFDKDIAAWVNSVTDSQGVVSAEDQAEVDALLASQRDVGAVFRALNTRDNNSAASKIKIKEVKGGKLYKVEVPENDELIMLDNKLSDQPPVVQKALKEIRGHMERVGVLEDFEDRLGDFDDWTALELTRIVLPNMVYSNTMPESGYSEELEIALTNGEAQKAVSVWLRDLGVKGARYLDRDSRLADPGSRATVNFVIFDDSAIQMKVKNRVIRQPINSPLSDPTVPNPGIFRRIHDQTMGLLGALAGKDVDAADNLVDAFKRKVTQRYQQIIKTQKRSAAMAGVDRLPAGQNPMEMITADERGYKLQFLTDNMIRPMATEMARRGVSMDDLGLFLYARHAPARNARIARINPEFRAPSNPGSGMTDAEAMQIMADFHNDGKINDLSAVATYIDQMIDYAQQERLNSGLISAQDVAAGFQPGDFYVPLRGNENIEPELEMDFTLAARKGGGFSTSGKEGHRMFGRQSKADLEEIVGYTITQAQEAIDRAYRNRVAQSMLEMFRGTPDPAFVSIDRVKRVPVWNKKKGQVEYQMQTRITDPKEQQRTIYVKEGGHVTKMTFNAANPSAMRFVKAAKNLGMSELPRILQIMSVFTRLWSKSNTQWNPDFILANATKDVQTGVLNAKTLDQKGLRRRMLKNLASLGPLKGALMGAMKGAGAGLSSSNPWFQTFAEFEANGGKLNYGQIEPLEDVIRQAKREMNHAKRSRVHPIRVASDVLNFIDHLNSGFENMTRLAAYKALRDMGIPAKQAAEGARELTTNFQQHGEWGPKFNAAYGFANASVIGGARFLRTVAKAPQVAAGLIALGMMSDILNSLGDDDEWDRYTEEDKHGNFIILLPAEFGFDIKIPAGYGLNAFLTTGRKMSELWRGKKKKDGTPLSVLDAASDVGMGFINAFAPITGSSFWNVVTPTIGDPVVNIYRNENNWGRPIMPTQPFRKEQQKPDSQLAFDNTSQFWRAMATTMNSIGGGNDVIPGFTPLDISPESYRHVTEETVGGAGRTFMRTVGLIEKAATGKDVGLNDIPIVRRFAGNPYGAATAKDEQIGQFYERIGEGRVVIAQAKEMMARYGKDSETYQEYRAENAPLIDFAETIGEAEKRLRAYNSAENAAERGAVRVNGLKRRDRKAIFKVTRIVVPSGRALTPEEVAKIKAKVKEKKERLALMFNDKYTAEVMKKER